MIRDWANRLADMQDRADYARRKAQIAQEYKDDLHTKITFLSEEAASDPLPDPMISAQIAGLSEQLLGLDTEIAIAQEMVDEIRYEYQRVLAQTQEDYRIRSVEELYRQLAPATGGVLLTGASTTALGVQSLNPFATVQLVRDWVWEFDPQKLDIAFHRAQQEPQKYYTALLNFLSKLSPQELADYFESHQDRALYALRLGDTTIEQVRQTQTWWNAELSFDERGNYISSGDAQVPEYGMLTYEQRKVLMLYAPGLIGNLDGVPYSHRSVANTTLLHMVSSDPEDQKNWDIPYTVEGDIAQHIGDTAAKILDKNQDITDNHGVPVDVQVINLEFSTLSGDSNSWDDIMTAVSVGNLDSSGTSSWLVHGMDNNAEKSADHMISAAGSLYDQVQDQNLDSQTAVGHTAVAWMSYSAPQALPSLEVRSNDRAHTGGHRLAQDIDTFNTVRGGDDTVRTNLVGHSYGTDVVFSALTEMNTKADSAVLLGSAGLDKTQVQAYNRGELDLALEDNPNREGAKNIYYADASKDDTHRWGYRVSDAKYAPVMVEGITKFSAEATGGREDVDGHNLHRADGDSEQGYLSENTSSLWDTAQIIRGQDEQITEQELTEDEKKYRQKKIEHEHTEGKKNEKE